MTALLPDLGPHGVFIWTAYAAFFLVIGGLAAWIVADEHRQRRLLAELEAQGVRRRSATPPNSPPKPSPPKPSGGAGAKARP